MSRCTPARRARKGAASGAIALVVLTGCGSAEENGEDAPARSGAASQVEETSEPDAEEGPPETRSETRDRAAQENPGRQRDRKKKPRPRAGRLDVQFEVAVNMLRRTPERLRADYDRDKFSHWSDFDGDGCDTRDEVLLTETTQPRRTRAVGSSCSIQGGRWRSWYDADTTRDSSSFDVDHMVPLAEAWDSGANGWSPARREAFANDQGDGPSLVAVSASSNRSKSDRDPSEWLPGLEVCRYERAWVAVELRWDLAADPSEVRELLHRVGSCDGRVKVALVAPGGSPQSDDGTFTEPRPASGSAPSSSGSSSSGGARSGGAGARSGGTGGTDPRFDTCGDANDAGYGDYVRGRDPEYDWYRDSDSDGKVCER